MTSAPANPPGSAAAATAAAQTPVFLEVWRKMRAELAKLDLAERIPLTPPDFDQCEMRRDPFDGSEALFGFWRLPGGERRGEIILYPDGRVFAEFDILIEHPHDAKVFLEGVTVWGHPQQLKAELKSLELPQ